MYKASGVLYFNHDLNNIWIRLPVIFINLNYISEHKQSFLKILVKITILVNYKPILAEKQ